MLWFDLNINEERIGLATIRRREKLDLADPAVIHAVCSYEVSHDGKHVGIVTHRYGDGAWKLVALAAALIAEDG